MDFLTALKIVKNHPELRKDMAELFTDSISIIDSDDEEFEQFYCDFVSMAVENNPSLLD